MPEIASLQIPTQLTTPPLGSFKATRGQSFARGGYGRMNPRIGLSRRNFVTGAAAVIATPRISAAAGPTIRAQPDNDLQDIPLSIRLSGFSPRQPVIVTAEMVTRDHFRWRSAAMFVVGADGEVDVGTTAPVGGSYSGVSPMGFIWSMERIGGE